MPNADNITAPVLVVGPGRCGSTWSLNALGQHPDVQDLIENRVLEAIYHETHHSYWAANWPWECSADALRERAVLTARDALCRLFPGSESRWAMKLIWRGRPWEFVHAVFPDAIFIHVTRSPTTALPSMMEFVGRAYDIWSQLEHCQEEYAEANAEALALAVGPRPYLRIRQEDAASDPHATWETLRCHAGLAPFSPRGLTDEINAARSTSGRVRGGRPPLAWSQLSLPVIEISRKLGYLPEAAKGSLVDASVLAALQAQVESLSAARGTEAERTTRLEAECTRLRLVLRELDEAAGRHANRDAGNADALRLARQAAEPLVAEMHPIELERQSETRVARSGLLIVEVRVESADGTPQSEFRVGEAMSVVVRVRADTALSDGSVAFLVRNEENAAVLGTSTFDERTPLPSLASGTVVEVQFDLVNHLRPGAYAVAVALNRVTQDDYGDLQTLDLRENAARFRSVRTEGRPLHYVVHAPTTVRTRIVS